MKIKKIIDLCIKQGSMSIFTDAKNDIQYMTDGVAIYPLEGVPFINADIICTMYDISDKKADKTIFREFNNMPEGLDLSDSIKAETEADIKDIVINTDGIMHVPISTEEGQMFIDSKYFVPISDVERTDLMFYLRHDSKGKPIIAVKQGLLLIAMIYPLKISEALVDKLKELYESSVVALSNQKAKELNNETT